MLDRTQVAPPPACHIRNVVSSGTVPPPGHSDSATFILLLPPPLSTSTPTAPPLTTTRLAAAALLGYKPQRIRQNKHKNSRKYRGGGWGQREERGGTGWGRGVAADDWRLEWRHTAMSCRVVQTRFPPRYCRTRGVGGGAGGGDDGRAPRLHHCLPGGVVHHRRQSRPGHRGRTVRHSGWTGFLSSKPQKTAAIKTSVIYTKIALVGC